MKKLTAVLIAVSMLFSLAECAYTALPKFINRVKLPGVVRVTIPEGFNSVQIAKRLEDNGVCTKEEFLEAVKRADDYDYAFINDITDKDKRPFVLEGYLFPDTYTFTPKEGAQKAVSKFLANAQRKFSDDVLLRCKERGFTLDEILTIASIIEKESNASQRKTVSSVLHNRLNNTYNRLECDVTIQYITNYVQPNITGDKDRYNEFYNTYKCYGLPTGPICNPGMAAIEAALEPEETNWMFFVSDKSGNYLYAETYEEHLENCKKAGLN